MWTILETGSAFGLLWEFCFSFCFRKTKTLSCYPFKTYFLFPTTSSLFQISMSYFLSGLIKQFFFPHQTFNQRKMTNYQLHFLLQIATKAHGKGECDQQPFPPSSPVLIHKGECDQHGSEWPAAVPTILSCAHSQVLNGLPHSGNHLWGKLISAF